MLEECQAKDLAANKSARSTHSASQKVIETEHGTGTCS
jgi:hypothetical protein